MRLMTLFALALLPAAWPGGAQDRLRQEAELPVLAQTAPGLDKDGCIVRFNCDKVRASDAPLSVYTTSESWMRYLIQMCGGQK